MKTAIYNKETNEWTWREAASGTGCACSTDREETDERDTLKDYMTETERPL